jgi:uncharacterized repeat protein (TIGR03803 family)
MRLKTTLASAVVGTIFCASFVALPAVAGTNYKVIRYFTRAVGEGPGASLIFDASGNLYSTTAEGGASGSGTVFELSPGTGGKWVEKVLYSFCAQANCVDGAEPYSSLVFDSSGNLYGTTTLGGNGNNGVVFQLVPGSDGSWTENVLYSFCSTSNCSDGTNPWAGLVFDKSGNLYGTASGGGANNQGAVFELAPEGNGTWNESVLYSFKAGKDGADPVSNLIFDASGNLYGTTLYGGVNNPKHCAGSGCGTVFELTSGAGGWTEQILYSFGGGDGANPVAGLISDASGSLYGATSLGGANSDGAIFKLSFGNGSWTATTLHSFDGAWDATGNLVFDNSGNLYGTCPAGGKSDFGIVFELSFNQSGVWTETTLHSFAVGGGIEPSAGLIFDSAGNLYGTAYEGGSGCNGAGCGTVFEITP